MTTVTPDTTQDGVLPLIGIGASKGRAAKLGLYDRPQVNLLPAEVSAKRQVAVVKRRMIWIILATVLVCVLAFGAAYLVRESALQREIEALEASDELTAQKRQYSPVLQVIKDIASVQQGRAYVLATEVNWTAYIQALAAVLPEGVTIDSVTVMSIGPAEELVVGVDELTEDAIGVMTFSATSPTLPDASAWIDTLESVPGLVDANLQSSELKDEEGNLTYQVIATVQVTDDALAHRTFPDEAPAEAEGEAEPATEDEG